MVHWLLRSKALVPMLAVMVGSAGAVAQPVEKPPPRPAERPAPRVIDEEKWARAYEDADMPVMLVLAGWTTGEVRAGGVGRGLLNRDTTGFAQSFALEFERVLQRGDAMPDVINQDALADAINRLGATLADSSEDQAIRLLARQVGADVVVVFELYGRAGAAPSRVTGRVLDMNRGRTMFAFPSLRWQLGTEPTDVKEYAEQLGWYFGNEFSRVMQRARRFTLRLLGVEQIEEANSIRDLIEESPGVRGRVPRPRMNAVNNELTGERESVMELRVTYDDDGFRLARLAESALDRSGEYRAEVREIIGDSVTLRVWRHGSAAPMSREACEAILHQRGARGEALREELLRSYEDKSRPRFTVLVNRRPTPDEELASNLPASGDGPGGVHAETLIVISAAAGGDVRDSGVRTGDGQGHPPHYRHRDGFDPPTALRYQAHLVETAMLERLGVRLLKLDTVDADEARRIVASEAAKQGTVFRESETTAIIREQNIADIVIYGMGGVTVTGGRLVATYTFRAVNVHNAALLGTAIVTRPLDAETFTAKADLMADEAIGRLMCDIVESWRSPSTLRVTLKNARGPEDFQAMRAAVEATTPLVTVLGAEEENYGPDSGVVTFRLGYTSSFRKFQEEFQRIMDALPYTLVTERSSDSAMVFAIERAD